MWLRSPGLRDQRSATGVVVILDSAVGLHQGGQVSAPVFQRVMQQSLEYLHVAHDVQLPANRQVCWRGAMFLTRAWKKVRRIGWELAWTWRRRTKRQRFLRRRSRARLGHRWLLRRRLRVRRRVRRNRRGRRRRVFRRRIRSRRSRRIPVRRRRGRAGLWCSTWKKVDRSAIVFGQESADCHGGGAGCGARSGRHRQRSGARTNAGGGRTVRRGRGCGAVRKIVRCRREAGPSLCSG